MKPFDTTVEILREMLAGKEPRFILDKNDETPKKHLATKYAAVYLESRNALLPVNFPLPLFVQYFEELQFPHNFFFSENLPVTVFWW